MGLLHDMFSIAPADENLRVLVSHVPKDKGGGVDATISVPVDRVDEIYEHVANKADRYFHTCVHNQTRYEQHKLAWSRKDGNEGKNPGYCRGTKDTAALIVAFWADIDLAYKNEKYPTPDEYTQFYNDLEIKPSAQVFTGNGLHLYWFGVAPIDAHVYADAPMQFIQYIESRMREAMSKVRGITVDWKTIDNVHDTARLLRIDGTKNSTIYGAATGDETASRQTVLYVPNTTNAGDVVRYDLPAIIDWLGNNGYAVRKRDARTVATFSALPSSLKALGHRPGWMDEYERGESRIRLEDIEIPTVHAKDVFLNCRQLAYFAENNGAVSEPSWYNIAGVLSYCLDGEKYFVTVSQLAEGKVSDVSEENSRAKMNQWKAGATGVPSCHTMKAKSDAPLLCNECPWVAQNPLDSVKKISKAPRIITPETVPVPTVEDGGALDMSNFVPQHVVMVEHGDLGDYQVHSMQSGEQTKEYLCLSKRDSRGNREIVQLCTADLKVLNTLNERDSASGLTSTYVLMQTAQMQAPAPVPYSEIDPQRIAIAMAKYLQGFTIYPDASVPVTRYIKRIMNLNKEAGVTVDVTKRFGWHDVEDGELRSYRYGNMVIRRAKSDGKFKPHPVPGSADNDLYSKMKLDVPVTEWTKSLSVMIHPMMASHLVAILAGFAAPLMRMLPGIGGATVFMVGDKGTGKSLALRYISSSFTSPDSFALNGSDSVAASLDEIAKLCDIPACMDEVTNRDPNLVHDIIFGSSSSQSRRKKSKDNETTLGGSPDLHRFPIISSNTSLEQFAASARSNSPDRDAEQSRAIEIHINKSFELVKYLNDNRETIAKFDTSYGWAFPRYIMEVAEHYDTIATRIRELYDTYMREWGGADPTSKRYQLAVVAGIEAAKDILHRMGLVTLGDVWPVVLKRMHEIVVNNENVQQRVNFHNRVAALGIPLLEIKDEDSLRLFGDFLDAHTGKLVEQYGMANGSRAQHEPPNPIGKRRYETNEVGGVGSGGDVIIKVSTINDWLVKNARSVTKTSFIEAMVKLKILLGDPKNDWITKFSLGGVSTRGYAFDMKQYDALLGTNLIVVSAPATDEAPAHDHLVPGQPRSD